MASRWPAPRGEQQGVQALWRSRPQIGAALDEDGDGARIVGGRSPHERRLTRVVGDVGVGARIEQNADGLGIAGARCRHDDGLAAGHRCLGVGPPRR